MSLRRRVAELEKPFSDTKAEGLFWVECDAAWTCHPRLPDETAEQAAIWAKTGPRRDYIRRDPVDGEELLQIAYSYCLSVGRTTAKSANDYRLERLKYYTNPTSGSEAIRVIMDMYEENRRGGSHEES